MGRYDIALPLSIHRHTFQYYYSYTASEVETSGKEVPVRTKRSLERQVQTPDVSIPLFLCC